MPKFTHGASESSQIRFNTLQSTTVHSLFPDFSSYEDVKSYFIKTPHAWDLFLQLPKTMQQELFDFCIGKQGLRITYDTVFQKIFAPDIHKDRLESLLSAILGRTVQIIAIIPRKGSQLTERGSFVIMDILVQLDDGSYANIEMQKIGYSFPLARADCYASDIIMRQYSKLKAELGSNFDFRNLHKVYCIILMEKSPHGFHTTPSTYIHKRTAAFDTNIYPGNAGLHEDIFICLDSFQKVEHTITKDSTMQEAWMTFLSSINVSTIHSLIESFPFFTAIYQELTDFIHNPKELITMLSEELYIMDRNLEKYMITEMQEEAQALQNELQSVQTELKSVQTELQSAQTELHSAQTELQSAQTERNIFKLYTKGESTEEIAAKLNLTCEKVNEVLNS